MKLLLWTKTESLKENKFVASFLKSESDDQGENAEAIRQHILANFKKKLSIDPIVTRSRTSHKKD